MDFDNILYTPLDIPDAPIVDPREVIQWVKDTRESKNGLNDYLSKNNLTAEQIDPQYPWDITPAWFNYTGTGPGWVNNFDKQFPEIVSYIDTYFGIPPEYRGLVLILPIKDGHTGEGFWHQDNDVFGVRFYLEFEDTNANQLLMKRTKLPSTHRTLGYPPKMEVLQDETLVCKMKSSRQGFYLNNVKSAHATLTTDPSKLRIAVIVSVRPEMFSKVHEFKKELVVRSAEKYKDYAILWRDLRDSNS